MSLNQRWRETGLLALAVASFYATYLACRRQDEAWAEAKRVIRQTNRTLAECNPEDGRGIEEAGVEAIKVIAASRATLLNLLRKLAPIHRPVVEGYLGRLDQPF